RCLRNICSIHRQQNATIRQYVKIDDTTRRNFVRVKLRIKMTVWQKAGELHARDFVHRVEASCDQHTTVRPQSNLGDADTIRRIGAVFNRWKETLVEVSVCAQSC